LAGAAEDAMVKQLAKQQEQLNWQLASGNAAIPGKAAPNVARQWWGDRRDAGQVPPKGGKSKNAKSSNKGSSKGGKDGRREY